MQQGNFMPAWLPIVLLSCVFLTGQESWQPTEQFARTGGSHPYDMSDTEMDAVCAEEFGPGFRVASWAEVVTRVQEAGLDVFYTQSGMNSYRSNGWVRGFYTPGRRYFIERHDGSVPSGWLVHDSIGSHEIDLGSWYNSRPILCYDPAARAPLAEQQ